MKYARDFLRIASMHSRVALLTTVALLLAICHSELPLVLAQDVTEQGKADEADFVFEEYFRLQTQAISGPCLADLSTLEAWEADVPRRKQQLLQMLGLDPLPQRTPLNPVITQTVQADGFKVHAVHFQSMPGLYVTGNLFVPDSAIATGAEKLPAILYLCGHGGVKLDGISYGNKVHYQHHGSWFARNGYVCLAIDSLQLGEIEGIHHGTYRHNMWSWLNRGYTPAGVEAWNCIRALDYLQSRPEVDGERIGATGRSGGGAYTWWVSALDDRVKVAVPVAGITDLQNHVVDGCVEGHCDCMFMVNTYRWDYPQVAAMIAPRPLLISNSDRDPIFPLDGVYRTQQRVRRVYELFDKQEDFALNITAGGHADTQELRVHAFRWLNHYLKGSDDPVRMTAEKMFEPQQLRVFQRLPADSINAVIHDSFVPSATVPPVPTNADAWSALRDQVLKQLRDTTFGGWPKTDGELKLKRLHQLVVANKSFEEYQFESQPGVPLQFYLVRDQHAESLDSVEFELKSNARDNADVAIPRDPIGDLFAEKFAEEHDKAVALIENLIEASRQEGNDDASVAHVQFRPRGYSRNPIDEADKELVPVHVRRRYLLLGQTLDGMRAYDIRRAMAAARSALKNEALPVTLRSSDDVLTTISSFAALMDENIAEVQLPARPDWDQNGPYLLNTSRTLTPQLLAAMLGDQAEVRISLSPTSETDQLKEHWKFALEVDKLLQRESLRFAYEEQAAGK